MAQNTASVDGKTGATEVRRDSIAAPADSAVTISLLTCSPGEQIHRLYGHTALRMQDSSEDWAINFGWFSFNTPNFVMKFILGLTDYSMAYQTMPIFIMDLMRDNMGVTEQVLNLNPSEAAYVRQAMRQTLESEGYDSHNYTFSDPTTHRVTQETIMGAHWIYRYNYLYDNCTTRAIDAIKEALRRGGETLVYPTLTNKAATTTQRTMIHEFTTSSPWFEFGQDLLLGPEVDEVRTQQQLLDSLNFLPTYAQNFFQDAQIRSKDGTVRPLVVETNNLTPFLMAQEHHPAVPISPLWAAVILLAVAVLITFKQTKAERKAQTMGAATAGQRAWRIWTGAFDFVLWTALTIVGLLLVVMVGWSEHPAVGTNWLLLLFNPLFILGIPVRLWLTKYERYFGWFACLMALAICVVGLVGLQCIPAAIYPIALTVAVRAAGTMGRKNQSHRNEK